MSETPVKPDPPKNENDRPKRKKNFLAIYVASLLVIAMVLLLFSFLQNRRASEQLSDLQDQHNVFQTSALQSIDDLNDRLVELTDENARLLTENGTLSATNDDLAEDNTDLRSEITGVKNDLSSVRLELVEAQKQAETYRELLELAEEQGAIALERNEDGTITGIQTEN